MSGAAAFRRIPALSDAAAPVRRNMLLLAAGMAALYGMVELATAVATLTFVAAGGSHKLAGLAPAIFLASAALAALPAGRSMDRFGRTRILRAGFAAGICGSLVAALGAFSSSLPAVVLGFVLIGASIGTVMLSRAAAADMYPPSRRPQAISLVLFGAVFGALLGPAVFVPLVQGGGLHGSSLGPPWLGAAGFMVVGLALVAGIRRDPQQIAQEISGEPAGTAPAPETLNRIVGRERVSSVLLAAVASWSVMVTLMTLIGSALIRHGHGRGAIFPVLSAHFVGMFGLFLGVGWTIDWIGRRRAMIGGLGLLGLSSLGLLGALQSVTLTSLALFGIGLGWSCAYVAATSELAESASAVERGKLLGLSDMLSGLLGAGLTILAGYILDTAGIPPVAIGAALVALLSALLVLARLPQPA
ncbi:MAG: MFS transporter [Actinomycetota bacterium]|nr:MFS transporter [Actinomycetota bacterium]